MDMYATNQNGPFASGGNIAGGFLPVMDFMSPGVKSELSVEGQGIVKGLLKSQTDDGKPFTEEHTAFVGSLLNTPTEGSGGFFSYPAQGNFIPKIGSNDIIGSSEPGKFFTICCMLLHPLSLRLLLTQSLSLTLATYQIHLTWRFLLGMFDTSPRSRLRSH
jgi:hypothetical protein